MNDNNSGVNCQRPGVIYKITNLLNGKCYIGQTIQKLSKRLGRHKNDKRPGISQAIKKYGWKNFSVEVLEECENREKLNEREIFWIAKLNTKAPNGYNLTIGGKGGGEHIVTEETRKKLSESHMGQPAYWKGKHIPDEVRAKVSEGLKRYYAEHPEAREHLANVNKGKKHSAETKAKLSAIMKANGNSPPSNKGKLHSEKARAKMSAAKKARDAKNKKILLEGSLTND